MLCNLFVRDRPIEPEEIPPQLHSLSSGDDETGNIDALRTILDFVSVRIDALRSLNPVALKGFDELTSSCLGAGASALKHTLRSHGWSEKYGWLRSMADFDALHLALISLYLIVIPAKRVAHSRTQDNFEEICSNSRKSLLEPFSFCPNVLLSHFQSQPESYLFESQFHAAAVIMDVVGLAELWDQQLMFQGSDGVEEVYHRTSEYIADMQRVVHLFHGDIISFQGSKFIFFFPQNCDDDVILANAMGSERAAAACWRALRCAAVLNNHHYLRHHAVDLTAKFAVIYGSFELSCMKVEVPTPMGLATSGDERPQDGTTSLFICNSTSFGDLGIGLAAGGPHRIIVSERCLELAVEGGCKVRPAELERVRTRSQQLSNRPEPLQSPPPQLVIAPGSSKQNVGQSDASALSQRSSSSNLSDRGTPIDRINVLPVVGFAEYIPCAATRESVDEHLDYDGGVRWRSRCPEDHAELAAAFRPLPIQVPNRFGPSFHTGCMISGTVVQVRWVSYAPATHGESTSSLVPFFKLLHQVNRDCGGYLWSFLVDDLECRATLVFGMPGATYSNNASRGCYCAVSCVLKASQQNLVCSASVTSGTLLARVVGNSLRKQFVIIGEPVTISLILLHHCSNANVLVDKTTHSLVSPEERTHLTPLESIRVKRNSFITVVDSFLYSGVDLPRLVTDFSIYGNFSILTPEVLRKLMVALDRISGGMSGGGGGGGVAGEWSRSSPVERIESGELLNAFASEDAMFEHTQDINSNRPVGSVTNSSTRSLSELVALKPAQNQNNNSNSKPAVFFTVLIGMGGCGKQAAAHRFKQGALKRKLHCIHVVANSGDNLIPYSIVRKILLEIVGENFASDLLTRREAVEAFLESIYPRQELEVKWKRMALLFALEFLLGLEVTVQKMSRENDEDWQPCVAGAPPSAQVSGRETSRRFASVVSDDIPALGSDGAGASNDYCQEVGSFRNVTNSSSGDATTVAASLSLSPTSSFRGRPQARPPPRKRPTLHETTEGILFTLLTSLFAEKRLVLIIENGHFIDELTWMELQILQTRPSVLRIGVLLTMMMRRGQQKEATPPSPAAADRPPRFMRLSSNNRQELSSVRVGMPPVEEFSNIALSSNKLYYQPSAAPIVISPRNSSMEKNNTDFMQRKLGLMFTPCPALITIMENPQTTVVELHGFTNAELKALYTKILPFPVTDPLIDTVISVSNGSAFWCKAIAQYLLEHGVESFNQSIEVGSVHNSIRVIVISMLEKLSTSCQMVIKYASVVGDEFSAKALKAILPCDSYEENTDGTYRGPIDVALELEKLVESGLIHCIDETPVPVYSFNNPLVLKIIYSLIPSTEAMAAHAALANFLEHYFTDDLRPYYASLSFHYRNCIGKRAKAFMYTVKSLDQALAMRAYSSALAFAIGARELAVSRPEVATLLDVVRLVQEDLARAVSSKSNRSASAMEAFLAQDDPLDWEYPPSCWRRLWRCIGLNRCLMIIPFLRLVDCRSCCRCRSCFSSHSKADSFDSTSTMSMTNITLVKSFAALRKDLEETYATLCGKNRNKLSRRRRMRRGGGGGESVAAPQQQQQQQQRPARPSANVRALDEDGNTDAALDWRPSFTELNRRRRRQQRSNRIWSIFGF